MKSAEVFSPACCCTKSDFELESNVPREKRRKKILGIWDHFPEGSTVYVWGRREGRNKGGRKVRELLEGTDRRNSHLRVRRKSDLFTFCLAFMMRNESPYLTVPIPSHFFYFLIFNFKLFSNIKWFIKKLIIEQINDIFATVHGRVDKTISTYLPLQLFFIGRRIWLVINSLKKSIGYPRN